MSPTCPICKKGKLSRVTEIVEHEFLGHKMTRELIYSVCDACGSEQAGSIETRANKLNMIKIRRRINQAAAVRLLPGRYLDRW